MIHRFSVWIAGRLGRAAGQEEKVEQIRYGIEVVIGATLNPLIVFTVATCLGLWKECFFVAATFASLRMVMGGYHFTTFIRCLFISMVVLIGAAYGARFGDSLSFNWMSIVIVLTGLTLAVAAMKWAPANERYREINLVKRQKLRGFAVAISLVWFLVVSAAHYYGTPQIYLMGSILGCWIQILIMPNVVMNGLSKFETLYIKGVK